MSEAPRDNGVLLPADALLRIDIEGEIRKLAEAQLQGDWQLVSECLRFALAHGAQRAEVSLASGQVELQVHGWQLDPSLLRAAAALRRGMQDPEAAHAALLELEAAGALALIVIAGSPRMDSTLVGPGPQGPLRLQLRGTEADCRSDAPPSPPVVQWSVRGLDFDRRRARRHTLDAARFAPAQIRVDGQSPPPAFRNALDVTALSGAHARVQGASASERAAISGSLAITREGDAPRIWITRYGLLAAHYTAASGPAFELAVEVGHRLDPRATGADLREYGEAALPAATAALVERMRVLAAQRRPPGERRRLALLCVQGLGLTEHARALASVPVFDRLNAEGALAPASLVDLRRAVVEDRGRRQLVALRPSDDPQDFDISTGAAVLDDELRARLASRLELDIQAPPLRPSTQGWSAAPRRALRNAWNRLADLGGLFSARPAPIPTEALAPHEQDFVRALSSTFGPERRVELCEGDFAPRWTRSELLLARGHQTVAAALVRCRADAAWAYPAALAIGDGRVGAGPLRKRWRPSSWMRLR